MAAIISPMATLLWPRCHIHTAVATDMLVAITKEATSARTASVSGSGQSGPSTSTPTAMAKNISTNRRTKWRTRGEAWV